MFTSQRIDQKQLVYLKTLLSRPDYDWSKKYLMIQKTENIWWAKQINALLDIKKGELDKREEGISHKEVEIKKN